MHLHVEVEKNLGKDEEEDQGWNGINNKIKFKKYVIIVLYFLLMICQEH